MNEKQFTPFDETDWQNFQGCETEPVVCYLDVTLDGEPAEMAAVIDTFSEWGSGPSYERVGLYLADGRQFAYTGRFITDRAEALKLVTEALSDEPLTRESLSGREISEL